MDEELEICQTCLSSDRFLYPVTDVKDFLSVLQIEVETKTPGFGVCWECKRLFEKFSSFKAQVLKAQELLSSNEKVENLKSLSALSAQKKVYHDSCLDPITNNILVTCTETGPILIKQEVTECTNDCEAHDTSINEQNVLERNCHDEQNTKSNESGSHNREAEEQTNISELPRITLVESLTEKSNDSNILTQPGTEIEPHIELNIPISPPVTAHEDGVSMPLVNRLNGVTGKEHQNNRREHLEANVVANSKNTHVGKEVLTNMESIMVKVVYKDYETEVHGVRIKEEPASEPEDMDDPITLNHTEETRENTVVNSNSTVSVSEMKQEAQTSDEVLEHRLWKKSVLLVYNRIRGHRYASRFLRPVTDAVAPEYSQVVREPMDLGTIKKKIDGGLIRTTAEFQRDMLLMLSNALMYNSSDHYIYDMTKDLLEEVKYQLGLLLTVHAHSVLPNDAPVTRPRRRLDIDFLSPPAKRPRISTAKPTIIRPTLTPRTKKKAKKIRPKVERKSVAAKVTPKRIRPKQERKSTVTKVKAKKITPKVERKSIASKAAPKKIVQNKRKSVSGKVAKKIKAERKSIACSAIENVTPTPEVKMEGRRKSTRIRTIKRYSPCFLPNPVKTSKVSKKQHISTLKSEFKSTGTDMVPIVPQTGKKRGRKPKADSYMDDVITGSEVNMNDYCVAITTEPQRDLSRDEASYVKKVLEEKILNLALDFSQFAPRFRGKPVIADGVVKLWCDDQKSLIWLIQTISNFPKKVGKFVVRNQTDLPKKIKSAIVVPGFNGEVEVILKLLRAQNPWAQVESWAVYSAEQRGESMILLLGIPDTVVPTLMGRQRRLAYSLGSVYVKFYNIENNLSEPPEVS